MTEPETLARLRVAARQAACRASWETVFTEVWESYEFCLRLGGAREPVLRARMIEHEHAA